MQKNVSKDLPYKNGVLHVLGNNSLFKHFLPEGPALVATALEQRGLSGEFRLTLIEQTRGSHHTQGLRGGIAKQNGLELYIQPGENGSRRKAVLTRLSPRLSELSERVDFYKRLEGNFTVLVPATVLSQSAVQVAKKKELVAQGTVPLEVSPQTIVPTSATPLPQVASPRKFSARDDTDVALLVDALKGRYPNPTDRFTYENILQILGEEFKEDVSDQTKWMSVVRSLLARGFIVKHERSVYGFPVPGTPVVTQTTNRPMKARKKREASPVGTSTASALVHLEEELAQLEAKADPAREVRLQAKIAEINEKIGIMRTKQDEIRKEIVSCVLSQEDQARVNEIKQKLASIEALLSG